MGGVDTLDHFTRINQTGSKAATFGAVLNTKQTILISLSIFETKMTFVISAVGAQGGVVGCEWHPGFQGNRTSFRRQLFHLNQVPPPDGWPPRPDAPNTTMLH